MHSHLFLTCIITTIRLSTIVNHEELRTLALEKLIGWTTELSGSYRNQLKGILFDAATGYTVSIIDHGEIVREDLSGRSAPAAASCNTAVTKIFS